jgi:hypothetical protein
MSLMRTYIIKNIIRRSPIFKNLCITGLEWTGMWNLKMIFDPDAPSARALPRQHYGLDFCGVHRSKISVIIIGLFRREVILEHVTSRSQLNVAATLLKHVILSRGVPISFRTDNAPELMRGAVEVICQFLNIEQIKTGGHT